MTHKKEAGQALVFVALALVVLLAFAGLGIDVGVLRYDKRLQQTAADAAALAGASNLGFGGVTSGAQNASGANGFTNGSNNVTVTVNNPPASGPHAGDGKYVEALVAAVQPTYFMRILGRNNATITARAVATNLSGGNGSGGCLYTLGAPSSSIEGVNINGSANLNATACGILDNGNFNTKGNKLIVSAGTFGIAGNANQTGPGGTVRCTQTPTSCPTPNMPATSDPLSYLTPPCNPCTGGTSISITGNGNFSGSGVTFSNNTYTISPGTYTSISISGTGSGNNVVFSPGLYIIDGSGGLTIPGNATISGTGVTFYFTNAGTINMTGTPTINLTAPGPSGQYPGILFYQDPNDTSVPTLGGNSGSFYDGALYFPKTQVTFYGNNSSVSVAIVIADAVNLSGNPTVNLIGSAGLPPGVNIIKNAVLVE